MPPRTKRLKPTPLRPKKRSAAERERIYGPKGRVEWVKSLPCLICQRTPSENAHTENGGMGRKADYTTIVPLCAAHHRELHQHGQESFEEQHFRVHGLWWWAQVIEGHWEKRSGGLTPLSAIVPGVLARLTERGEE